MNKALILIFLAISTGIQAQAQCDFASIRQETSNLVESSCQLKAEKCLSLKMAISQNTETRELRSLFTFFVEVPGTPHVRTFVGEATFDNQCLRLASTIANAE